MGDIRVTTDIEGAKSAGQRLLTHLAGPYFKGVS